MLYRISNKQLNNQYRKFIKSQLKKLGLSSNSKIYKTINRSGKRLRPTLILLGYQAATTQKPLIDLKKLQFAFELLHTYAKLKDDLIDSYPISKPNKNKLNLQVMSADLCLLLANQAFSTLSLASQKLLGKDWNDMQLKTWTGQFEELFTKKPKPKKTAIQKTALYSFAYPLSMGAKLGGNKKLAEKLFKIGQKLGLVYQIQDDLIDINEDKSINRHTTATKSKTDARKEGISKLMQSRRDIMNLKLRPEMRRQLTTYIDDAFHELER